MPIDTREKRASTTGIHFFVVGPGVTVNVAKDQEWRKETGYGYSGGVTGPPGGSISLMGVGR